MQTAWKLEVKSLMQHELNCCRVCSHASSSSSGRNAEKKLTESFRSCGMIVKAKLKSNEKPPDIFSRLYEVTYIECSRWFRRAPARSTQKTKPFWTCENNRLCLTRLWNPTDQSISAQVPPMRRLPITRLPSEIYNLKSFPNCWVVDTAPSDAVSRLHASFEINSKRVQYLTMLPNSSDPHLRFPPVVRYASLTWGTIDIECQLTPNRPWLGDMTESLCRKRQNRYFPTWLEADP